MIRIQAPDGSEIEFPDGTDDATITRVMRQNFGGPTPQAPAAPERSALAPVGQFGAGVNTGISNLIGAPFDLVNRGLRAVGVPIPEGSVAGSVQSGINAVVGEPEAPQTTGDRFARGAGRGLVDAASFALPAAGLARATQAGLGAAPSLVNRSATALAAQPVLQATAGMAGGAVGDATGSPLAGFAAALATPLAAGAVGRAVTPARTAVNPAHAALVRAAEAEGIPLTAGQATGNNFLRNIESQMEQLPLTSGPARVAAEARQTAFTRAVLQRAGTNADNAGPDVLNATRRRIGAVFDDVTSRNTMRLDNQALNDFAAVETNLQQNALPEVARTALNRVRQIIAAADNNGDVTGTFYRRMDSAIGRQARETSNGDLRAALVEVRDAMRVVMDRNISPQDAAAWQEARQQYANFAIIRDTMGRAGANTARGQISPLGLMQPLNRSTGRGFAEGRGDMNTLARIGQSVVREPNDSGTAGRTLANNLLTGGIPTTGGIAGTLIGGPIGGVVGAAGSLALPRLVQAMMNTPGGQAYLRNQLVQNPQMTGPLTAALLGQQGLAQVTRP